MGDLGGLFKRKRNESDIRPITGIIKQMLSKKHHIPV